MDGDELIETFRGKAALTSGITPLFTYEVSLEIIDACAKQGVTILGIDFFKWTERGLVALLYAENYSDLARGADASAVTTRRARERLNGSFPVDADLAEFVVR